MEKVLTSSASAQGSLGKTLVGYVGMIAGAVALFEAIGRVGAGRSAPPPLEGVAPAPTTGAPVDPFVHVLLALVVVIVSARALGWAFQALQQPPVIGEVIAGIALGPSLLGRVAPGIQRFVLPPGVAPFLSVIAQVGVVLFMFLVGLELDTRQLRRRTHVTVAISHASIILPFLLGAALALWIYPTLGSADVPFTVFALFLGVSMSITAFPVLARILNDRGMQRSKLGIIALTCAAADDVTAWCLLAFLVSVADAHASRSLRTVALTVGYITFLFVAVRPLVERFVRKQELCSDLPRGAIATVFVALLASALATEAIGIHAIFGAFLLGAILPNASRLARELVRRLEDIVVVVFLPAFFAFTGMRTRMDLLSGPSHWAVCAVIVVIASAGKFGGTFLAARLTGLAPRDAVGLGILMNTRGLMELVILNVGLDLRIVSPTLFTMLVTMAVVTTMATAPVLHRLERSAPFEPALEPGRPS